MILLDDRAGSQDLYEPLKKAGLPVKLDRLDGGDLFFLGRGPNASEVTVGVEHKTIRDLLSSIRSQRLQGHQLFEMQVYDFKFLMVEGEWIANDAGQVCTRGYKGWAPVAGNFSAAELDKTLLGFTLRAGIVVKEVSSRRDTVRWLQSLYRNFNDVGWEDHSSHTGIWRPPSLVKPSPFRNFIAGIPSVGLKRSRAVEAFFTDPNTGKASPRRATAARRDVWEQIEGIGKKGAETIDRFLEGE